MRQVQQIMGMPISIDIPGCEQIEVFEKTFDRLRQVDERFSTFKPGSEASRFIKGDLAEGELSKELKRVIKACKDAEKMTDGYFSAWYNGSFDPLSYVKGWAVAEAGQAIEKQGFGTYCIGAGGDILARSDSSKIWHIGIQDPRDKTKILNKLSITNGAVATSGNYERGPHITNPKTKQPAENFLSVTVSGPQIIMADVLATAIFASGDESSGFLNDFKDYKVLIIK